MQKAFHNLIQILSSLPGIGPRSALRIALHLMKSSTVFVQDLSQAIVELKQKLRFCKQCGGITEREICEICGDPSRDDKLLCLVEEAADIFVIEKSGEFSGLYHVLMGALSPLDGIGPEELRLQELKQRLDNSKEIEELFIATNPTLEGDATADYVHKLFQDHQKRRHLKITRISHGIPTGSAIEFAEASVLARSIRTRVPISASPLPIEIQEVK